MSTDSDIIRRSRVSPSAFGELYDRHAAALYRYAARRAGVSAADDVMSETFLVAFERRGSFDHTWDDAGPWLFGIATNLLRAHHRTEMRMLKTMTKVARHETQQHDEYLRIADQTDAQAAVALMADALKRMSTADRECLLLYAWADLTYEGIALAMEVPIGTVRSRLNRVRRVLRESSGLTTFHGEETDHGRTDIAAQNA